MDIVFGEPQKKDGEVWVSTRQGSGRPMFKQFNGVKISELHEDTMVFNLQENDISSYDEDIRAAAKVHKQEWFGRDVSDRVLEKAYSPPTKDGHFTTQVGSRGVKCFGADKTGVPVGPISQKGWCVTLWWNSSTYGLLREDLAQNGQLFRLSFTPNLSRTHMIPIFFRRISKK